MILSVPMILLEGFISVGLNEEIWSEPTDIKNPAGFPFDLESCSPASDFTG
jgi:hypothetical protein